MSPPDQRRHPRIEKPFMLRYRVQSVPEAPWMLSPLKDLSRGGARFLCEQELGSETLLEVELMLPSAVDPVAVMAKVVRVQLSLGGLYEHGVAFEPMSAESTQAIGEAVGRFLKKRQARQ